MQLKSGARYYGTFKDGLPDGEGLYNSGDLNSSYKGSFKAGKFHGIGDLLNSENKISQKAEWENGKMKRVITD